MNSASAEARISVATAGGQYHPVTASNDMLVFTSSPTQCIVIGVGSDGSAQSTATNYLSIGSNDTIVGNNLIGTRTDATWSNAGSIVGNDIQCTNVTVTGTCSFSNGSIDPSALAGNLSQLATGTVSMNLVPDTSLTYDLGTPDKRFRDLYISGNTST
jgi:hypothetical protein